MPSAASVKHWYLTIWLDLAHVTVLTTDSAHYAFEGTTVFLNGKCSNST